MRFSVAIQVNLVEVAVARNTDIRSVLAFQFLNIIGLHLKTCFTVLPLQKAEVPALAVVVAGVLDDGRRFPLCSSGCILLFCCEVSLGSAETAFEVVSFVA
jgi:hypothetical protein